ncbi:MAG TPA: MFS transporter [bacterium]|nr:MFS transporter [bacterium]
MLIKLTSFMGLKELEGRDPREVRSVFLLLFMSVFLTADTMLLAPNVKYIMAEFGKDEAQVGLISTIFIFFGAIITLLWGYFADRYTRKYLVIATIFFGEVPCLLTGYVHTYEQLLAVRVLTGLGVGGMMPLIFSMIGDLVSERERSTAAAWIGLAEGLGMAVGMVMAGNLGASHFTFLGTSGWRLPFVLAALPNFALAPMFWLTTAEPTRGAGEKALRKQIEKGAEYTRRIRLSDYPIILGNRTNLYFFMQSIPGTIGWGVLPYWIITFYATRKNVSIPMATNLSLLIGVGMMLGGFAGGIIGNLLHARNKKYLPLLCGVTTLLGFGFFLAMVHYPLPPAPTFLDMAGPLAVGIIGGFLITITSSNIRAIVLNVNPPENRGAMMSLFTLTDSIGKGAGPLLGGLLIGAVGYYRMMDIATLSWIPCGLVFLFLMTPQYPRDAAALDRLMAERAKEIEKEIGTGVS